MPSQDDINHQQELLAIHRRNLAHYLGQQAQLGKAVTPLGILNGILEERANIKRIKGILRGWGVAVDDHPDDELTVAAPSSTLAGSAGTGTQPNPQSAVVSGDAA